MDIKKEISLYYTLNLKKNLLAEIEIKKYR